MPASYYISDKYIEVSLEFLGSDSVNSYPFFFTILSVVNICALSVFDHDVAFTHRNINPSSESWEGA